jgi:hypothetical protein
MPTFIDVLTDQWSEILYSPDIPQYGSASS